MKITEIKKTHRTIFIAVCTVIVGTILSPLLLSLLAEEVREFLKIYLNDYYLHVLIGSIIICIFLLLLTQFYDKARPTNVVVQENPDLRKQLIQNLRLLYKHRFADKMKGDLRFNINLKLKYTTIGTSSERVEKFYQIKEEAFAVDFDRLFEDYIGKIKRLLILGEPGAGKSILMLNFGLKLIEKAEKDENFPVPIVLDLATWKNGNQTFEHWLEQNLPYIGESFAISKEESRRLVDSNALLLLLDGFDEIQEQYRDSCLEKLQIYLRKLRNSREETLPEVIICSRISEYLSSDDAPVFATIVIQPLQPKDVQNALKSMVAHSDEPAIELQRALNDNPYLYTAITSAFFLHILLNIYTRGNKHKFISDASKELLQKNIIKIYIQNEFEKLANYSIDKQKKWLGWLAWKLKHTVSISTFELAYLQPHWVKRKPVFNFIDCTFIVLFVGLLCFFYMLPYRFIKNESIDLLHMLYASLKITLFIFVVVGISRILKFFFKKNDFKILTKEILEFRSFKKMDIRSFKPLFLPIINSLIYGLSAGLLLAFILWWENEFEFDDLMIGILFITTLFFVYFNFIFSLINIFIVANSFPKINSPYKRLLAQFSRDIFQTISIFFISFILMHYFSKSHLSGERLLEYLSVGILLGLMISIILSPIFKHCSLRLVLIIENAIPLNLVAFLNSISKNTGLLIGYGGQWRFRHKLILDSLANEFEENHPNLLNKRRAEKNKSYSTY